MRKLVFITGTRADYGKLEPLALKSVKLGFEVHFFVTGMHLMERYGLTSIEVARNSEFRRREFPNQNEGDNQDQILANTINGFSTFLNQTRPDLVLIHGDRIEALAASLVCSTNYIRSAHIEGGEISGTIDEVYRHCNTKLCTAHLVSSIKAKKRVVQLGEHPDRIFVIGSPELDRHDKPTGVSIKQVLTRYDIPWNDFGVAIFHPVTSELDNLKAQANSFYSALNQSGKNFVIIAPNNDPGKDYIFSTINELPKERFRLIPSMRFHYFSELLRHAKALVGNSSAGVREAPFLGLPSLDIGTRQNKRNSSASIVQANAFDTSLIKNFLESNWGKKYPKNTSFGVGDSSEKFRKILLGGKLWGLPLQKVFFDDV
jgi:UDP-N-acetylglucosamine 2-epimerase (hydrolysing)